MFRPSNAIILTSIILLGAGNHVAAADKRLDFWAEGLRLFSIAKAGEHVDAGIERRRAFGYESREFSFDQTDHRQGDMSVVFNPGVSPAARFGFVPGLWGEHWRLSSAHSLRLWLKTDDPSATRSWKVILVDRAGQEATGLMSVPTGPWTETGFALADLMASDGFDWSRVVAAEFEGDFTGLGEIRLDDVRFEGNGETIGVTDKTAKQRLVEAAGNRELRTRLAFEETVKAPNQPMNPALRAFAMMMANVDLVEANRLLADKLRLSSDKDEDTWDLFLTPAYCRIYYWFSNRVGKLPGRMTPETETLLLRTLWERTAVKNDIFWARQSTWYLDGSENHDLNAKVCNLVTSRIFMNEPEYRDRIYPDYGFGGGYHYGHAGYYGAGIDPESRHGGGRANLADGGSYNAADHYEAWRKYLRQYFRERLERGFFLEYGSPSYSKHSLGFADLAHEFGGDEELRRLIGGIFDVFWADWAQVSIAGLRGGPKTRHHRNVGGAGDEATADLFNFSLGAPGNAGPWWYWNLVSSYRPPEIVMRMALDREGLGVFTYRSRGIGEEVNELPRPLGTERSLVVDTEARFLKYAYVTPDYVLGTQMDHPSAVHSHLSVTGRWHGMIFAGDPSARIVPVNLTDGTNKYGEPSRYDMEAMYQTVQRGRTLIVQQSRRWYAVHPEWYPVVPHYELPVGIWLGKAWDRQVERNGWIFVQKGNAYAGVRPVSWDEAYETKVKKATTGNQILFNAPDDIPTVKIRTDAYTWNEDRTIALLEDRYAATVIEAGRSADYATLEDFMADVLNNPIALYKTVVPGDNILVYTGCGPDAPEIVFSCAAPQIPTVGGQPIDYAYPMTWDSPYLKSNYKSGKVRIEFDGEVWERDFMKP